jgi:hypothetical protein
MNEFELRPKLRTVSHNLVYLAIARKAVVAEVGEIAAREVRGASCEYELCTLWT